MIDIKLRKIEGHDDEIFQAFFKIGYWIKTDQKRFLYQLVPFESYSEELKKRKQV